MKAGMILKQLLAVVRRHVPNVSCSTGDEFSIPDVTRDWNGFIAKTPRVFIICKGNKEYYQQAIKTGSSQG